MNLKREKLLIYNTIGVLFKGLKSARRHSLAFAKRKIFEKYE
jgi:hypothetical protein